MISSNSINRKRVAILIENQFEDSEFQIPYTALQQANATITVVGSRMNDEYNGKRGTVSIQPDATATEVRSEDFDAIIIPGGSAPDRMRRNQNMVRLVIDAMAQQKLIAAVCHGPQLLIEADQLRGKRATGFISIRKDMQNAGASYLDDSVVVDENLITSRRPGDLPLFTTMVLVQLGLSVEDVILPDAGDRSYEWWQLGEQWGGSSRQDILNALNTAILGERYTISAFQQYSERSTDVEAKVVLSEAIATKQHNMQLLEQRLAAFGEQVTWQTLGSEAFATLQNWLQANDNNLAILRRALGDIQTGLIDAAHFSGQITDPFTAEVFDQIHENLSRLEQRLGDLYRARAGERVQPPMPTTIAAN